MEEIEASYEVYIEMPPVGSAMHKAIMHIAKEEKKEKQVTMVGDESSFFITLKISIDDNLLGNEFTVRRKLIEPSIKRIREILKTEVRREEVEEFVTQETIITYRLLSQS